MKSWRTILLAGALAAVFLPIGAIAEPDVNTNDGDLAVRSGILAIKPEPNPPVIGVPAEPYDAVAARKKEVPGYAAQAGAWTLFLTGIGGVAWFAWRNLQTGKRDSRWKKRHAKWLPF